jgi:hypothetical protein
MPIEDRNVEPGVALAARYKGKHRTCEVVQTEDGLRYRLDDGTEHRSPSSAGKTAMGGIACNGWRFWSLAGTERPMRKPKGAAKAKTATKSAPRAKGKKAAKSAKKPKGTAMRATAKGDAYGCGACGESFPTMKAATTHALTHTSA